MYSKKSSGHIGTSGVQFVIPSKNMPIIKPNEEPEPMPVETVFRQPKQKNKKLKFQRE